MNVPVIWASSSQHRGSPFVGEVVPVGPCLIMNCKSKSSLVIIRRVLILSLRGMVKLRGIWTGTHSHTISWNPSLQHKNPTDNGDERTVSPAQSDFQYDTCAYDRSDV